MSSHLNTCLVRIIANNSSVTWQLPRPIKLAPPAVGFQPRSGAGLAEPSSAWL